MQFRLLTALMVFLGSYLPLAVILLSQNLDYAAWQRDFCWPLKPGRCALPVDEAGYSITLLVVTFVCFSLTVLSLALVRPAQDVAVQEAEYVPIDLMNYTLPYVVSFMGIDYNETSKFVGFCVFLAWMFWITHRSGQVLLNPVLISLGWRLYKVTYNFSRQHGQAYGPSTRQRLSGTWPLQAMAGPRHSDHQTLGAPMAIPAALSDFDIQNAGLTVWLFKKSGGGAGAPPTYTGRWITTENDLNAALKAALIEARGRSEEVQEYGLLAQNNEASALLIDTVETHAGLIVAQSANPLVQKKVKNEKEVINTDFFVVRLTEGDKVLLGVRKTDGSWKTRQRKGVIDIGFRDNALELDRTPSFSLSKHIDFFIAGDRIVIPHKGNFESVLSYRQAHANEFAELQVENEFAAIFTNLNPLTAFVGSNKIHLRRMCSIRQKGHYKDHDFMDKLRQRHTEYGLTLDFDENGLIVCTAENCRYIITALLDHRLGSAFSENVYDVPDATQVG